MMININAYIRDTIRLANSIIFKFEHINIYINQNLKVNYGITDIEKENSKYYLNMYGLPFKTDRVLETYIPDINEYGILNKSTITQYPLLRNDLLNKGSLYIKLLSTYRRETSLIKGIISPIPIDTAINAIDGAILQYDKTLITDNEDSIIPELERFIKKHIYSYYNKKYNIDEYYLPGFLSTLYNNLPLQILRIRLSKIFTSEVDDFNLYAYLNSNKYLLQEDVDFVNKESLIWLYGNMKHLNKHMGHNSTINSVIENIFTKNIIGVAKLNTNTKLPVLNTDDNLNIPVYEKDKTFISNKVNSVYKNSNEEYTLKEVMELELNLNKINTDDYDSIYTYNKEQLSNTYTNNDTNIFLFDKVDIRILYNTTILNIIFNNLLYYSKQTNFNIETTFLNPSDNKYITVNKDSAFYILLYALVLINNNTIDDVNISNYSIEGVITGNLDIDDLTKNTILGDKLNPIVEDLISLVNETNSVTNEETFSNKINNIRKVYAKIWYYITNTNDIFISSDLKIVFDNFINRYDIPENSDLSLRELIDMNVEEGFNIIPDLAMDTVTALCKTVFNLDVNEYVNIESTFNKYINFIKRFKSYTIQFLYDTSYLKTIYSYSTSLEIGQQHRTIGNIYNSYFRRNNNINIVLSSISMSFNDTKIYANNYIDPYEISEPCNSKILTNEESIYELSNVYTANSFINTFKMSSNDVDLKNVIDINNIDANTSMTPIDIATIKYNNILGAEQSMLENLEVYSKNSRFTTLVVI